MVLSKETITYIVSYILQTLGDSELAQFFRPHSKTFRTVATKELVQRENSSSKASHLLIQFLTFHLIHGAVKTLNIPLTILHEALNHSLIKPKLAVLIHVCIGIIEGKFPKSSYQFLEVVSHLTINALAEIFLVQITSNKSLINKLFERYRKEQKAFVLDALVLSVNFLDNEQKLELKSLLTPKRITCLRSPMLLNNALSIVNENVKIASLKKQYSTEYVTGSYRKEIPTVMFMKSFNEKFKSKVIKRLTRKSVDTCLYDKANLTVMMMIWPKISNSEKQYIQEELSARQKVLL